MKESYDRDREWTFMVNNCPGPLVSIPVDMTTEKSEYLRAMGATLYYTIKYVSLDSYEDIVCFKLRFGYD